MEIVKEYLENNPCYKKNLNYGSDKKYLNFQKNGPEGFMLHSVGCAQPKASVFTKKWNSSSYNRACVHGFIDANNGVVHQTLPWNFLGWHAGGAANNTHVGVEMCEPDCIKYTGGSNFTCSNLERAREMAKRTYQSAVELFAMLCKEYNKDPLKDGVILSHREGARRGVASNHGDPEHLWNQLGLGYTMDTFRQAVKEAMGSATPAPAPAPITPTPTPVPIEESSNSSYKVGDVIKLVDGATYASGKSIPSWVFKSTLYVRDIRKNGDIVFSTQKTGAVTGVVSPKYIVGANTSSAPTPGQTPAKFESYLVSVSKSVALNYRSGPGTNYKINGVINNGGTYTIVEEADGPGASKWGRLKSGAGWISLDYAKKV